MEFNICRIILAIQEWAYIILRYFMEEDKNGNSSEYKSEEQILCKICFLKATPLLRLCGCKGSIGFVHEECILKWISFKLQQMTLLQIPCCELCRMSYSAEIKPIQDRVNIRQLVSKIKEEGRLKLLGFIFTLLLLIILPYVEVKGIEQLFKDGNVNYIFWLFNYIICPWYFVKETIKHTKQFQQKLKDCRVRQVQIYLLPKQIYR